MWADCYLFILRVIWIGWMSSTDNFPVMKANCLTYLRLLLMTTPASALPMVSHTSEEPFLYLLLFAAVSNWYSLCYPPAVYLPPSWQTASFCSPTTHLSLFCH